MLVTGAAAARLYDDHVDAVYALVARRVGTPLAPTVTGQTFEYALRNWDRFNPQNGTERLFLLGAATVALRAYEQAERVHLRGLRLRPEVTLSEVHDPLVHGVRSDRARVVDHIANDDVRQRPDGPGRADGPSAPDDDGIDTRTMAAISDLAPDDRDILLLSLWERCSQHEIAEALDIPVGAVRSALGRIRRDLKIAVSGDDS